MAALNWEAGSFGRFANILTAPPLLVNGAGMPLEKSVTSSSPEPPVGVVIERAGMWQRFVTNQHGLSS